MSEPAQPEPSSVRSSDAVEAARRATVEKLGTVRERIEVSAAGRRGASSRRFSAAQAVPVRPTAQPEPEDDRFDIVLPEDLVAAQALDGASARRATFLSPWAAAGLAVAALLASAGVISEGRPGPSAPIVAETFAPGFHVTDVWMDEGAPGDHLDIATASTPAARGVAEDIRYLDQRALRELLRDRPVKCVVAAPLPAPGARSVDAEALRLAASIAADCVETVTYQPAAALLVRETPAPDGGRIEINAAFSVADGAVCHHTRGLSALVIGGDMPVERARSLESLLEAGYASLRGKPICHRLQPLGEGPDGPVFRADAFVDGRPALDRSDPRPFVMKRAERR